MLNLDTHILIHALHGDLSRAERQKLTSDKDWGVSAIVLWEIEKLYQKGRILYGLDFPPMQAALRRLQIWPVTPEI